MSPPFSASRSLPIVWEWIQMLPAALAPISARLPQLRFRETPSTVQTIAPVRDLPHGSDAEASSGSAPPPATDSARVLQVIDSLCFLGKFQEAQDVLSRNRLQGPAAMEALIQQLRIHQGLCQWEAGIRVARQVTVREAVPLREAAARFLRLASYQTGGSSASDEGCRLRELAMGIWPEGSPLIARTPRQESMPVPPPGFAPLLPLAIQSTPA